MLNKVTLIGNLGADVEVRYMPNGGAVTSITLATSFRWKDKQSGEKKEATEWHRVVFYNKLAEIVGEYLKKGSMIYVEGRLQTRKWQKDGIDHYTTEIIATEMKMLNSKRDGGQDNNGYQPEQASAAPRQTQHNSTQQRSSGPPVPPDYADFNDADIPF